MKKCFLSKAAAMAEIAEFLGPDRIANLLGLAIITVGVCLLGSACLFGWLWIRRWEIASHVFDDISEDVRESTLGGPILDRGSTTKVLRSLRIALMGLGVAIGAVALLDQGRRLYSAWIVSGPIAKDDKPVESTPDGSEENSAITAALVEELRKGFEEFRQELEAVDSSTPKAMPVSRYEPQRVTQFLVPQPPVVQIYYFQPVQSVVCCPEQWQPLATAGQPAPQLQSIGIARRQTQIGVVPASRDATWTVHPEQQFESVERQVSRIEADVAAANREADEIERRLRRLTREYR